MPVPTPKNKEDLSSCIRALRREGYIDSQQRIAICLQKWRDAQKETKKNK